MSGRGELEVVRDATVGEEVWLGTTAHGLRVRVLPTERFRESAAMVAFRYGSVDLSFDADGVLHQSPEGVAHYLEHKLFEDQEVRAFDRFAARGASVNAMTGFTRTSYHFTATDQVEENLADLLHLVSRAHITQENVDKERGIIAQELRMYEDSPDYRLFYACLGGLYAHHPVRHPVGGTVESIQRITPEELLRCYRAFYRAGNAALAVAGPVDPERVLDIAQRCELRPGNAPGTRRPRELGPPPRAAVELPLPVPRAKVMIACKERSEPSGAEPRARRELLTQIVLDRLFSAASEVREQLRRRDLVDDTLSYTYLGDEGFGLSLVSGETEDPKALAGAVGQVLCSPLPRDAGDLERVRRKLLGRYVRSFESVRGLAFSQAAEALEGLAPFSALDRLRSVTAAEVEARRAELFQPEAMVVAVGVPAGGAR